MKRIVYAVLATLPAIAWIAVEGCSSPDADETNNGSSPDASTANDTDANNVVTQNDSGGNTPKDSGTTVEEGGDAAALPGTMIETGSNISIVGTTSDGYVVYVDSKGVDAGTVADASDIAVLKVAAPGKTPTIITSDFNEDTDDLAINGMTVAYYPGVNQTTGIAPLMIWTAANGVKQLTTTSVDGVFAAAADGSYVAYATNASSTAGTFDVEYAKTDATGEAALITAQIFDNKSCPPQLGFTKAVAFASTCTSKATTATATLRSLDTGTAGAKVITVDTALVPQFFNVDPTATNAFSIKSTKNAGSVVKVATGTNAVAEADNTSEGFLDSTGANLIYLTSAAPIGLFTAKTAAPVDATEITAGDGGVVSILEPSPDLAWAIINYTKVNTTNQNVPSVDLNIVSTAAASTPTALGVGEPVGFDSTSKYFFYVTGIGATAQFLEGALKSHAVAGGTDKIIAADGALPVIADGTTKVLYLGNASQTGVDIIEGDATGTGAPVTVVPQVDGQFDVTKGTIFYTANNGALLYYVAVP